MDDGFFDLVLAGGEVVDGSGAGRFRADVGVRGDRIAAVGMLDTARCTRRIDARGKVVAPGFVDTHAHDDAALLQWPALPMKTSQGVTTVVIGNCGISLAPTRMPGPPPPPLDLLGGMATYRFTHMAHYFRALEEAPPAVNVAALVGHMGLRASTMVRLDRTADQAEIRAMRGMLDEAMDAGAIGLSTGLAYAPSLAADSEEVVALASHVARRGGMYCTHIRDEADHVMPALCEACETARRAELPLVVSHHKLVGRANFGRSVQTLALLADAARRQPLGIDAYPYAASSTVLKLDRVRQSTQVLVAWSQAMPSAAGRTLAQTVAELGCDEEEAVRRLSPAGAIYFAMDEVDVQRILAWPLTMLGSDGLPHDAFPHPRLWGSFPRMLGHYVRERGLMSLEQAVHRMTGLPARSFGLRARGLLREGCYADIAVFDAGAIAERASFAQPVQAAAGMDCVLVNGQMVWENGVAADNRPGRVLRRQALSPAMADFVAGVGR